MQRFIPFQLASNNYVSVLAHFSHRGESNWSQVIKDVDSNLVKFDYLCGFWISPSEFYKFCARIFMSPNSLALKQTNLF